MSHTLARPLPSLSTPRYSDLNKHRCHRGTELPPLAMLLIHSCLRPAHSVCDTTPLSSNQRRGGLVVEKSRYGGGWRYLKGNQLLSRRAAP
jgi:hypothetical protein